MKSTEYRSLITAALFLIGLCALIVAGLYYSNGFIDLAYKASTPVLKVME